MINFSKSIFAHITFFICSLLFSSPTFAGNRENKPILIISSYNPETSSTAANIAEFQKICDSLGIKNPIQIENMNCKNLDEAIFWKNRFVNFTKKYIVNDKPDIEALVILGQEAWSSFVSQDDMLFKDIPVIVNLISSNGTYLPHRDSIKEGLKPISYDIKDIEKSNIIISTTYNYDIQSNLNLISLITPNINKIAFISDNTFGG